MGNIRNRPTAPAQVVYVPQPVYTSSGGTTTGTTTASNGNTTPADTQPTPEQSREQSLLSRSRSRLGTILTGFRGILTPVATGSQKKTLLGE